MGREALALFQRRLQPGRYLHEQIVDDLPLVAVGDLFGQHSEDTGCLLGDLGLAVVHLQYPVHDFEQVAEVGFEVFEPGLRLLMHINLVLAVHVRDPLVEREMADQPVLLFGVLLVPGVEGLSEILLHIVFVAVVSSLDDKVFVALGGGVVLDVLPFGCE